MLLPCGLESHQTPLRHMVFRPALWAHLAGAAPSEGGECEASLRLPYRRGHFWLLALDARNVLTPAARWWKRRRQGGGGSLQSARPWILEERTPTCGSWPAR